MIRLHLKKIKVLMGFLILIVFMMNTGIVCLASSATISFSTKNTSVIVGDTVTISLIVSSASNIGDFETYISYDSDVLEFKEGGAFVNGGDGILKVSDINNVDGTTKKKYILTFKAIDTGASEVKISDKAVVFDYDAEEEMSVSSSSLSIHVSAQKETSTNNSLKSLKISPGTLSPAFNKDTTSYSVDVNNETTSLIVSANPEDSKTKVTVKNATNLVEGENKVVVTVKAESGDIKNYTILVNRQKSDNANDPNSSDASQSPGDLDQEGTGGQTTANIHAENVGGALKVTLNNTYEIVDLPEDLSIPEGYVKTSIMIDNINVPAYTLEDDLDNDFLLLYAKNKDGVSSFYRYDRVEQTIQRYDVTVLNSKNEQGTPVIDSNKNQDKMNQLYLIMFVLIGLNIITILVIIRMIMKKKGFKEDDFD